MSRYPPSLNKSKRLTIDLPEKWHQALKVKAAHEKTTMQAIMTNLVYENIEGIQ